MDLLGSILNSMDKPPCIANAEKNLLKKQKEEYEKRQKEEKEYIKNFREKIEKEISEFTKDATQQKKKYDPMDKMLRTIIHDVADIAGLSTYSFGLDELDRYVMLFKKEHLPSDDELAAYRKGQQWNDEIAKEVAKQKEINKLQKEEDSKRKVEVVVPTTDYKEKYEHLIGRTSAKEAAHITTPNTQFGCVPSELKKDHRSIEQTLADMKAKKRQKTSHDANEGD